jgi:hypothetical protein
MFIFTTLIVGAVHVRYTDELGLESYPSQPMREPPLRKTWEYSNITQPLS